jgi:iron uptake system EfeUOB component EfeO/EfeM
VKAGVAAALAAMGLLAAGCGDRKEPQAAGTTGTAGKLNTASLAITDAGCDPSKLEIDSGPTTFLVANKGASAVTELEILQNGRILGEIENLVDGLSGHFTLSLQPGERARRSGS